MLDFLNSYYFLILWGMLFIIFILLLLVVTYRKELFVILIEIKDKLIQPNQTEQEIKTELLDFKEKFISGRVALHDALVGIQDEQQKIYKKIEEHDNRLDAHDKKIAEGGLVDIEIDVDTLSKDIANSISNKVSSKRKVDKLVGGKNK